jgi:deoxyhypusine synthase
MSAYDDQYRPLDLKGVKTYPLSARPSKVNLADFAKPIQPSSQVNEFFASLPNILAVQNLRQLVERIHRARSLQKPIIWGLGGHVIKTGLAPLLIDLMTRGFITAVAGNGSVLVHDSEIAMVGSTSEDVDATLSEGVFGGAEETAQLLNRAAQEAVQDEIGLGEAVGRRLVESGPRHADFSLLCAAYKARVPVTAHVTIGGDIAHFHREANGAALGQATHTDFRLLAQLVRQMDAGGVYLNVGSAVVLPEVFLKCVTVVRNLGHQLTDITTANFDFIQSYRPQTNVVRRPTQNGAGHGYSITGHHELTIPLLAAMLVIGPQ